MKTPYIGDSPEKWLAYQQGRGEEINVAQSLEAFANEILRSVLKDSGHVLYSSAATLCRGNIYLFGHNPGGSPEGRDYESIERSIFNLALKQSNEYHDDSWNGLDPGESKLQKRVCWLLDRLNMDVRKVCASNLIFSRSIDAENSDFTNMASLCWPVHEYILDVVQPTMVLTFGNREENSPFSFLREKLGVRAAIAPHPSGHGEWKCKAFFTLADTVVIGLPHLSRYAVDHHEDVPRWIRKITDVKK